MSDDGASGPLDVATLELLARRASEHPIVESWSLRPDALSPRRLELGLDSAQYPSHVDVARLDVRWFEGSDYSVHYLESSADATWQCRWDRHPKPGGPRAHFHPPPDAGPEVEASKITARHPLDVLFAVLDWAEERIEELYAE